jgi:hypothetical protein
MNNADPKQYSLEQELFLFISFQDGADNGLVLPQNNFAGSILLARLLESKLEAADQLLQPSIFCGPLNHSTYLCPVISVHESTKIICALLEKIGLLPLARIYRFDTSELIYRNLFPASGHDIQFDEFRRTVDAYGDLAISAVKQITEKAKQFAEQHQ